MSRPANNSGPPPPVQAHYGQENIQPEDAGEFVDVQTVERELGSEGENRSAPAPGKFLETT